ncbi:fatty acid desaturase [Haloactinopolyspora alba]|uniref:Fatty acid desaturase n=1 Tax=Haloactinopolyspora alba TaxID=648780 RepID=A0A2P8E950_9ACTN|nr:acyl-CoA desaturase [Haloactinopolyspora alba]PSL06003.1 fatty acid desaturase [Haloactinopolyspora alba]
MNPATTQTAGTAAGASAADANGATSPRERHVSAYAELTRLVQSAGLLRRRYGYYWAIIGASVAAFAGIWVGFAMLGNSWYQLLLAAGLAVVLAQFGFLGHEGAHRQIFASHRWNEWAGRVISGLFTGLSYGWWMRKHNRHHANPNKSGADPDVAPGVLAFTPEAVEQRSGLSAKFARKQGYLFFPLLLLEGLALHVASIQTIVRREKLKHRWVEALFVATRLGGYIAALLIVLPPGKAAAFFGVQMGLFGLLLGGVFAPNHKGMPIVPANMKIDFLQRQVLMSRNITGGRGTDLAMGGLNLQIEHHLFPNMPRPNLRHARPIVRQFCEQQQIPYTETSLVGSYRIVVDYLNNVGLRARDPFQCPLTAQYRV